ncbi:nucleotide exchange factor SIL1 isoform X2 [Perognathus longimembris pacificus]|uniref:nucleotide exchange factor SIL1 isoform X2 n=1 Tax=Perognathus longimembris pacificus TaxID=214514 RepID=UPI002019A16C|nr:nucleotide exchange factor SIL1 isoform X2 [Perognathus longimembris pacificus]
MMAPQCLPPYRMAPLGMLLGWLLAFCFAFCLSYQNPNEFALTNPEKSSMKESERKETKAEEELDPEIMEVFHPTEEWQVLQPGQAVPAGSHVRLNLQTGAREVKLQYEEDKFRNNLKGLKKGKRLDINTNTYTSQDLKSALAKLKEGTEMKSSKEDEIDNAQDLLSFGGLQVVINGLNSTEPMVKEYAAFVLGAAFSSNPKVQVEAIEGGALQKLLVILATEQPLTAKKKVLFALCSLLRHFPYAQQQFLKLGGLQVLRSLVQDKSTEVLAVRVVTLLYDLVTEKMFAEEEAELTQDSSPEKLQQYRQVHLLPGLREQGWCEITAHLLALPEHDAREKVLQTLGALLATCRDRYRQDAQLGRMLGSLQAEYQALATLELREGEDDGYFRELLASIDSLLKELR